MEPQESRTVIILRCFRGAVAVDLRTAAVIALPAMVGARAGVALTRRISGEMHALIFNGMSVVLIPTHWLVQVR
jgi:uncharacterized membrane protein YfcA